MPEPKPASDPVIEGVDLDVLDEIQRRVLWLAVRIIDAANHDRDTGDGVKVGGHQASSASLVTAMTALYLAHLDANDRVSVKPHASPVFHAIQYLLGNLDRSYLTQLRARGGLQSYPSRTKDPDVVDFSTGSVGLGAAAPLFANAVRRYVDSHFGERPRSRFVTLMGDAELDEGNVWEAISDPATKGLGDTLWIVDLNRQSLDRVVPGIRIAQLELQFEAAGWNVIEVKYGRKLHAVAGGAAIRKWIDDMPNERYQSMFALSGEELRTHFLDGAPKNVVTAINKVSDDDLGPLVQDLGGHDLVSMLDAYKQADACTDRPSVIFAYTVKGWGLPIAGNPRNHSALLSTPQVDTFRDQMGLTAATEWDRIDASTPAGAWCVQRAEHLKRPSPAPVIDIAVPQQTEDPALKWNEGPTGQHIELGISEMNLFLLLGQLGMSWDISDQPLLPIGTVYDPFRSEE